MSRGYHPLQKVLAPARVLNNVKAELWSIKEAVPK